jgi:hypothetical protein
MTVAYIDAPNKTISRRNRVDYERRSIEGGPHEQY